MIDKLLNGITMYRSMLYFLIILWLWVFFLTFLNVLPFNFLQFSLSSIVILISCYITNKFFSKVFKVPTNLESIYISSLILIFIIFPAKSLNEFIFLTTVAFLAMASKYILALNKKHIFNPAAISVFITSVFALGYASWWIGNVWTAVPILIGGFLIGRKIKRFELIFSFLATFLLSTFYFSFTNNSDLIKTLERIIFDSPIWFFAFVMLIEPLTSPTRRKVKIIYGLLVGLLAGSQFSLGPIYSTYETALIFGNIFAFFVGFKRRLVLSLFEKKQIGENIWEFVFAPDQKFVFNSGQYLEWTLSHKNADSRGVRRYFTIASSPTEEKVHLGVKIEADGGSSFKKALIGLMTGSKIYAGELGGDFILPKNTSDKLVFIAGGIGITPFRSIVKSLIDRQEKRDIVIFYACSTESEFVYKEIFDKALALGVKTVYVCSHPDKDWRGRTGRIDEQMLEEAPDFKNRKYYLSGPNAMVEGYRSLLLGLNIRPNKIVTDYFPGY